MNKNQASISKLDKQIIIHKRKNQTSFKKKTKTTSCSMKPNIKRMKNKL